MSKRGRLTIVSILTFAVLMCGGWFYLRPYLPVNLFPFLFPPLRKQLTRPYGMAPAAFGGFVRACTRAQVHPWRISQTIGNAPRSVGYHHRDGTVLYHGKKVDYTAAVDIATNDLARPQIFKLVDELGRQGFAAFYREGPKWVNGEHIHAVYAPLKMKPQLRRQVREWERKRRRAGKPKYAWLKRWRKYWSA